MRGLGLVASVFITLLIVLVKCEEDGLCSSSEDCKNGCCYLTICTTDEFFCGMVKTTSEKEEQCSWDWDCPTGCCIDQQCKPKSSFQCIEKNGCTTNSECDSNCCKNYKCQLTDLLCVTCSSSTDCYKSNKGSCCVSGTCGTCRHEGYWGRFRYSGGIVFVVVIISMVKLALGIWWCSNRSRGRVVETGRVVVSRRVRTCVNYAAVPTVENDELQRAHERAEEGTPDYPPPAYSPIPEPHADSDGQTLNRGEGIVNKSYNGVQQEPPMLPPPAYEPRQDASENTNSVQTEQAQRGQAILVPPPPYSTATNQHTAQTGPTIPNP